ncbi:MULTISPECIES: TetR/AcrR family transcriptional regulator [unclassified Brevibacterium]|uniref:TetR/AcrR family transcriptional regulator n=1 Tax=unclassified Brevibacterium TaxID=2614124 RepID=UPI0010F73A7B|nr:MULTISPECIES: TetR/AcrR family transcriptional regulator [unclassified Brevibacterium]MCM1013035.1 TetR/AcrR family transcriptional regulator [Brevibacterium sp. XM4083]
MARPSKNILSPSIIAEAALTMVERDHDFTIPGIAKELGVNPSSLYHHVRGGRDEIINLMREALYGRIDLGAATAEGTPWQGRLRAWIRSYRANMAKLPAAMPLLVGSPVDDLPTLRIYEVAFAILDEIGIPAEDQVDVVSMLDAVVLGSALDRGAPVPMWQPGDHAVPHLQRAVPFGDDDDRSARGLELAITGAVAAIESLIAEAA